MEAVTADRQTTPSPQGDGDSRAIDDAMAEQLHQRFDTHGHTGPVLVHTEKSGPIFEAASRVAERDRALTALVEPMARMLYRAMQVQALGAIDTVEWEDLTVPAREQLVNDARQALHLQSPLYRSKAERAIRHEFHKELREAAFHFPYLNPVADHLEQQRLEQAMKRVVDYMELLDIPKFLMSAWRRVLTEPLKMASNAQIALTSLRWARQ